jgi:hypothetical protein
MEVASERVGSQKITPGPKSSGRSTSTVVVERSGTMNIEYASQLRVVGRVESELDVYN